MSSPTRNSISSSHKKHSLKNNTTTSLPSSTNNKKQKQSDTDIASRALAALNSDTDDNSINKNDLNNNSDNAGKVVVQSDKENSVSETQDVDNTTNSETIMDNATKTTLDFTEKSMNDIVDMTNSNDGVDGKRKSFDNFDNHLLSTEDTDIIIPHSSTSQYNNILSSYLSTPFDKHAMISLHCTKEGLSNNSNNNNNNSLYSSHNSPHSKVERKRKANSDRLVEFNNWIDKQQQDEYNVPNIISQKQYIKRRKRAEVAAKQAIETQGSDEGGTLSSEAINKAILSFLIKEAENNLQGRMLQERLVAEQQQQKKIQEELKRRNELATVAGIDQNGGLTPRTKKRVVDELLSRQQQQVVVGTIPPPVHKPSQEQQQISTQQRYASMNNSMLETQIQRQQMEQQQLLSQMASMGNTAPQFGYPQQQQAHPVYNGYQQNNMNVHQGGGFIGGNWQYPTQPFNAAFNAASSYTQNAYIQGMAHQSFTAPPSQINTTIASTTMNVPTKKIPVATAEIVELTNSNRNEIAKLPVAFGFTLIDNGTSEIDAKNKTEKWLNEGKKHINDGKNKKKGTNNKENKKGSSRKSNTPSKGGTKGGTPGKSPAELLSTEPASNLPNGWLVKVFKRMSGATAGSTDKYFYSPNNEIKFRSIKACNTFIGILTEPGVNGDEAAALKLFKSRGNRN